MPVPDSRFRFSTAILRLTLFCLAATWGFAQSPAPGSAPSAGVPPYKNPDMPMERRIADLVGRMTLEEKVAQLTSVMDRTARADDPQATLVDEKGAFQPERAAALLKDGIGQMSRPSMMRGPRENAEFVNAVQKWAVEQTRLGIPVLFHEECLHGHAATGGTSFPQALALASTWDPATVERVFAATALEVRARGSQQCLTPVLDIVRDPRWGRTEETYGEDPFLAARIGVAAVKGFQGEGSGGLKIDKEHVIATAKHFAVHGQPEGGANTSPGNYSERVVRESFLKPFEAAVREAGIESVMASYNEIDGIPSHANGWLLGDLLRGEWGFDGTVVSDYFGIKQLDTKHHVADGPAQAAKQALEAGVDIELPYWEVNPELVRLAREGKVSEGAIDRALARNLRAKFITGLFDDPYVSPERAEKAVGSDEHRQVALEAARKSIILLKNEGGLLPLKKGAYKRIAVIGPNAKDAHLGGYSGFPAKIVSILDGVKAKAGDDAEVLYAVGVEITETAGSSETMPTFAEGVAWGDPERNAQRIKEAVAVAQKADVIVLALGGNEQTSREAWENHLGDRLDLDLPSGQDELAKAMVALGKPVVAFLIHGRPNSINYLAEHVPAILEGWYLGQEGGTAAADVLFGDCNPGGKLPLSVPRSVGQLPVYYNQKPSARLTYVDGSEKPLYPFGWGLSYTKFDYGKPELSEAVIGTEGKVAVKVKVANVGAVRGDEVVQLYIRDEVSSVTRPVKELKGFRRVTLDAGESQTVEFVLGPDELSLLDRNMRRVVEPGTFKVMVGGDSANLQEVTLTVR